MTRLVVLRLRHDETVDAVSAYFAGLKVGDQFALDSDVGPLSTGRHRDTVERYIAVGKTEGAPLAYGR